MSFPSTIPFSESIGFIARIADPDEDIDYPFYVTAPFDGSVAAVRCKVGDMVERHQVLAEVAPVAPVAPVE